MKDWNDFQYILALEEGGTMKKAAALLGMDPTTVSRHIRRISEEHGTMLFQMHKGGGWEPTAAGEALAKRARSFRNQIAGLKLDQADDQAQGTIKITSLDFLLSHYLTPHLGAAIKEFPGTQIELLGTDRRVSLAFGEADLALRFGRPEEGQLIASKIMDVEFVLWGEENTTEKRWIGLAEELDWTPEMQYALRYFDCEPTVRVTSFAAARRASLSLGLPFVSPCGVVRDSDPVWPLNGCKPISRELWAVIHETRRFDQRLAAIRSWAKSAILSTEAARRSKCRHRTTSERRA